MDEVIALYLEHSAFCVSVNTWVCSDEVTGLYMVCVCVRERERDWSTPPSFVASLFHTDSETFSYFT